MLTHRRMLANARLEYRPKGNAHAEYPNFEHGNAEGNRSPSDSVIKHDIPCTIFPLRQRRHVRPCLLLVDDCE